MKGYFAVAFYVTLFVSATWCVMSLQTLHAANAVCNDGTPGIYYLRKTGNQVWVIYLEGGGYCYDPNTCAARWATARMMMSSSGYPKTMTGTGILSENPNVNPNFWSANSVFVPYCSSDVWSGAHVSSGQPGDWHFQGTTILNALIDDLVARWNFKAATIVILSGTSAGGMGVMYNIDWFADRVNWAKVVGIVDSGFFLDIPPYISGDCSNIFWCPLQAVVQKGLVYWNGQTAPTCRYGGPQRYLCYFGPSIYPTRHPLLIMQFRFDSAQLALLGVYPPYDSSKNAYIQRISPVILNALKGTSPVFAPSCNRHGFINDDRWNKVTIGGVTLNSLIVKWFTGGGPLQLIDGCNSMDCNRTCHNILQEQPGNSTTLFPLYRQWMNETALY
jgi:hypothetical protein